MAGLDSGTADPVSEDSDPGTVLMGVPVPDPPGPITAYPSLPRGIISDPVEAAVAGSLSPETKAAYTRDIRLFLADIHGLFGIGPATATFDDLLRWWEWLKSREIPGKTKDAEPRKARPSTLNRRVAAVKRFYREGCRRGLFSADPSASLPLLRVGKDPIGRALTPAECGRLLAACPRDAGLRGARDHVAIALLLTTGARASEVARAGVADLSFDAGVRVLALKQRKGGKETRHPLAPSLSAVVDAWVARGKITDGPILRAVVRLQDGLEVVRPGVLGRRSIHALVSFRAERAGLGADVGPHDLRKTFITMSSDGGHDLVDVSDAAGHSTIEQTRRYILRSENLVHNPGFTVWGMIEHPPE